MSTYDTEDPVELGQQTVYVITIRNESNSATTNVRLKNDIPREMEFVSVEGATKCRFDKKTNTVISDAFAIFQPGEKLVQHPISY